MARRPRVKGGRLKRAGGIVSTFSPTRWYYRNDMVCYDIRGCFCCLPIAKLAG